MALVPSQVILSLVMIMACVIFPVTLAEDLKPAASGGEAQGRTFGLLGAGLLGAELATLGGFGGYGGYPGYGYGYPGFGYGGYGGGFYPHHHHHYHGGFGYPYGGFGGYPGFFFRRR